MSRNDYEQVYDGQWWNVDRQLYLACCHCALVHLVSFRLRNGRLQARFDQQPGMTKALRRKEGIGPKHGPRRGRSR